MTQDPAPIELIPISQIDDPTTELRFAYDPVALRELAQDIAAHGLLQPIGVKLDPETNRFRRLWGGRRLEAHRLLGRFYIPAIRVDANAPELDASISENLHRADLSPVEEAVAVRTAVTAGYTPQQVSLRWHKSERWVEDRLALLTWPDDLLDLLHRRQLTLGVAEYLSRVDNADYRAYLAESAITGGATVAVVRAWVAEYEAQRPRIIANQATIADLKARPRSFVVSVPCDGCNQPVNIELLKTFRICPTCDEAIPGGKNGTGRA